MRAAKKGGDGPFARPRCDLLGKYANGLKVTSGVTFTRGGGGFLGAAFELPDGVARDVEPEGRCGRGMPVAGMLTLVCGLRNFELDLG